MRKIRDKIDLIRLMVRLRKHRSFQSVVTCGIISTAGLSIFYPTWAEVAALLGAFTNLIWLWEPTKDYYEELFLRSNHGG
jgi:hypothetical protein